MRVLVIEDDRELAEAIGAGLRREGMAVDVGFDGRAGLERALANDYDVIVLDRDLPGIHGDEVCAEIVAAGGRPRVLMLTAAAAVDEVVDGLAAPTTTWASRSRSSSWWRGSGRCFAARSRPSPLSWSAAT
jgi:DNA-binding response OmpR family regulator